MGNTPEHHWITLSPEGVGCYVNEQDARSAVEKLRRRYPNPSAFAAVVIIDALRAELAAAAARAEEAFEKGLSAAVYALYLWDGTSAADVIAKELGYQSTKDLAEKAQDETLLGAIAALKGGAA